MESLQFETCKQIVEWLMKNENLNFSQAMCIVSYAIQSDKSLCEAYMYYFSPLIVKKTNDE